MREPQPVVRGNLDGNPLSPSFTAFFCEDPLEVPCNWGGWLDGEEGILKAAKDKNVNGKPEFCEDIFSGANCSTSGV